MSVFSDVQELYNASHSTWDRMRPHVLAHVLFGILMIFFFRVSLPPIPAFQIDARTISENDWFKLAKDTGLVYAALLIPLVLFSAYVGTIELLGRIGFSAMTILFGTSLAQKQWNRLSSWELLPIALTFKEDDFTISDLTERFAALTVKFQASKSELWVGYRESIGKLNRDAAKYVGDFLAFLVIWNSAFLLLPRVGWTAQNAVHFWSINLFLIALLLFAWRRAAAAAALVPKLQLAAVRAMLKLDTDIAETEEVSRKRRADVQMKLDELIKERDDRNSGQPSLVGLMLTRFDLPVPQASELRRDLRPFPNLYREGRTLSWDMKLQERAANLPVRAFVAIAYYRASMVLTNKLRMLGGMLRYIILGMT